MPNLLAMSFEGELAPSFTLHCLNPGRTLPDGGIFLWVSLDDSVVFINGDYSANSQY